MKKTIRKKIQDLRQQIRHHDNLYYNLDHPKITDYNYDQLFKQLLDLEKKYPELKTKNSPSQKIPGKAIDKFKKSAHSLAMLSLQNSYSKEELQAFFDKVLKFLNAQQKAPTDKSSLGYFLEPKLDGVGVELIYEKGILTKALTRGDGKVGENITENIKTLRALPLGLEHSKNIPELLEVRGEVLILKKDFKKINLEQEEAGLSVFANPRNLAAGSLRQLDPKVTASRPLYCFIHSPGLIKNNTIKSQKEFIETMQKLSLPTFHICKSKKLKAPLELCRFTNSIEEILDYYEQMLQLRPKLPFEIDGIVIKLNDFEKQKKLGVIARSPRWAMAGKFPAEEGITEVKNIRLQLGRTGVVTPVADLKAISLSGVLIRQASLHNFQDLGRKDIRIGDFVVLHRAGDVIPEIIKPILSKRKKNLKKFNPPTVCPNCKSGLQAKGDYLICQNQQCSAIREKKLIHFASKKAMNIEFLGEKSLKKFYEWGWLNSYSDLYNLQKKALKDKKGFGEKSHKLLVESLNKSKKTELYRLIFALGIPLIGEQVAQKISEKVYEMFQNQKNKPKKSLDLKTAIVLLKKIRTEELEEIADIGPLVTQSFIKAFKNKKLTNDLKKLHRHKICFVQQNKKESETLKGMNFVITGTLPEPREEIKKRIEAHGGKLLSQISKKTHFLIAGDNPGSKKEKAQKLNLKTLNWDDFLKIIR